MVSKKDDPILLTQEEKSTRCKVMIGLASFSVVFMIIGSILLLYVNRASLPASVPSLEYRDVSTIHIMTVGADNNFDRIGLQQAFAVSPLRKLSFSVNADLSVSNLGSESDVDKLDVALHHQIMAEEAYKIYDLIVFVFMDTQSTSKHGFAESVVLGQYAHAWLHTAKTDPVAIANALKPFLADFPLFPVYSPPNQDKLRLLPRDSCRISLSLLNPASSQLFKWDIVEAEARFLQPFFDNLEPVMSFEYDAQVLYFTDIAGAENFRYSEEQGTYQLDTTYLHAFFKQAKWQRVSPLVFSSLEFMIYVPSQDHSPLVFVNQTDPTHSSSSFAIPEWGGVIILDELETASNDTSAKHSPSMIPASALEPALHEVIHHLRGMLGFARIPSLQAQELLNMGYVVLPTGSDGLAGWEYDQLLKERVSFHVDEVLTTLHSLFELLENVGSMPVSDDIGQNVHRTVELLANIEQYLEHAASGREMGLTKRELLQKAMEALREAIRTSRKGFYDPSMIPLLYFPNEHVYAVYFPLFLPILAPLIGALKRRKLEKVVTQKEVDAAHEKKE